MGDSPGRATWLRQPDESSKAFVAFCVYRDMLPDARTLVAAATACGKSLRLISRWSATHCWSERAAAFDSWADQRRLEKIASGRARMAESLASDALQARRLAMTILTKNAERLEKGRRLASVAEGAKLLQVASALEIECRGEPSSERVAAIHVHIEMRKQPRYATEGRQDDDEPKGT
jgi:hypothetical protein